MNRKFRDEGLDCRLIRVDRIYLYFTNFASPCCMPPDGAEVAGTGDSSIDLIRLFFSCAECMGTTQRSSK